MRILEEVVERYLRDLRPERSEVMREMEELAERDSVPIVHWETGRLLAVLCRVLDPVVLEVGKLSERAPMVEDNLLPACCRWATESASRRGARPA